MVGSGERIKAWEEHWFVYGGDMKVVTSRGDMLVTLRVNDFIRWNVEL